jgi:hypothetical protein
VKPQNIEEARTQRECLPAELFPEGNWGVPQDGLQLSIRFEKQSYLSGEPVLATILLRNITNRTQVLAITVGSGPAGNPVGINAIDQSGKVIAQKTNEISIVSGRPLQIFPGTQRKFQEDVSSIYFLPINEAVTVNACLMVGTTHRVEIQSAKTTIRIESQK